MWFIGRRPIPLFGPGVMVRVGLDHNGESKHQQSHGCLDDRLVQVSLTRGTQPYIVLTVVP